MRDRYVKRTSLNSALSDSWNYKLYIFVQKSLSTDETIGVLHRLEQVSSEEMVGSLAENLMEALTVLPEGHKKVS